MRHAPRGHCRSHLVTLDQIMNAQRRFAGATILLTGIGRPGQVGEVVARAFVAEGARLLVVARHADEAEARTAELRATGGRADAFVCGDLSDAAQVERFAGEVRAAASDGLDAVVHAAGGFAMSSPVAESDPDGWHRQIAINLTTAYLTTRAFVPQLRARRGSLVYFTSIAALSAGRPAGMAAYAAAKSGVIALMRAVAEEERAAGVRANAVAPTLIRTAANVEAMGDGARYVEREEVAAAVTFLASEAARAVSGQVLRLG